MATEGIIAVDLVDDQNRWIGVHHHYESQVELLGRTLWEAARGHFAGDLRVMGNYLLDTTRGWASVVHANWSLPPQPSDETSWAKPHGPVYLNGHDHGLSPVHRYTSEDRLRQRPVFRLRPSRRSIEMRGVEVTIDAPYILRIGEIALVLADAAIPWGIVTALANGVGEYY